MIRFTLSRFPFNSISDPPQPPRPRGGNNGMSNESNLNIFVYNTKEWEFITRSIHNITIRVSACQADSLIVIIQHPTNILSCHLISHLLHSHFWHLKKMSFPSLPHRSIHTSMQAESESQESIYIVSNLSIVNQKASACRRPTNKRVHTGNPYLASTHPNPVNLNPTLPAQKRLWHVHFHATRITFSALPPQHAKSFSSNHGKAGNQKRIEIFQYSLLKGKTKINASWMWSSRRKFRH